MPSISTDDARELTGSFDALPVSALPLSPAPEPLELLFGAPEPTTQAVSAPLPTYNSLDASEAVVQLIGGGDFSDVLWRCLL
ncbi:hypothetical protein DFO50_11252 [Microvirgula sp. AG722]|uniref:Uncharacterized protein n=1 Tax=Microvirgula aerodenitrificans TaxID=57480 RepID=A0A2S0P9G6_9NEIS|nr:MULTISPECIES: hypothetical protein [Microvirgula]AVY94054.1 hypothetical protein DAI18_08350 [Microvirgula aerodenitrificans]RAS13839.1 hypothetical protein DFO50_11252 [Microvirgula sp. AG722]